MLYLLLMLYNDLSHRFSQSMINLGLNREIQHGSVANGMDGVESAAGYLDHTQHHFYLRHIE